MRIFLRKNDISDNPKKPYFELVLPPAEGDPEGKWTKIGALWKAKSGNGYSGNLEEGITLDFSGVKKFTGSKVKIFKEPKVENPFEEPAD